MRNVWEKMENLKKAEQSIGLRFPGSFVSFVRYYDEKQLCNEEYGFYSNETGRYERMTLDSFFSFSAEAPNCKSFTETVNTPPRFFPSGLVAFAWDYSGNMICFDFRPNQVLFDPPVVLWHKTAPDVEPSFIAITFEVFLRRLKDIRKKYPASKAS